MCSVLEIYNLIRTNFGNYRQANPTACYNVLFLRQAITMVPDLLRRESPLLLMCVSDEIY